MAKTVYIETSVPSAHVSHRSDPASLYRRAVTRLWWHEEAQRYELTSSVATLQGRTHDRDQPSPGTHDAHDPEPGDPLGGGLTVKNRQEPFADPLIDEVRENRRRLVRQHGGLSGWIAHLRSEQDRHPEKLLRRDTRTSRP